MPAVTTFNSLATSGTDLSFTATTAAAYTFANDGNTIIVLNDVASANSTSATIATPGKAKGETITAVTVTAISADGVKVMGPFPPEIFNAADGTVSVTWNDGNAEFALVRI